MIWQLLIDLPGYQSKAEDWEKGYSVNLAPRPDDIMLPQEEGDIMLPQKEGSVMVNEWITRKELHLNLEDIANTYPKCQTLKQEVLPVLLEESKKARRRDCYIGQDYKKGPIGKLKDLKDLSPEQVKLLKMIKPRQIGFLPGKKSTFEKQSIEFSTMNYISKLKY